jgi:translation initiation factor IF-1
MNDRFKYINTLSKKNLSANSNVINTTTGNRLSGGVPHMVYGKYKGRISGGMKMRVWVASRTDEVLIESMVGTGTDSTYWWSNVGTFPTPWKAGELLEVELEDSTNKMGGSTSIKLTNDGSDCAEVIHVNTPVRILGIDWDGSDIPKEYSLVGNFPNPFNPTTTLMYGVPVDSKVKLEVFNMLGQLVAVLADEVKQTGYYTVTFGSQGLPSGVYFYRMTAGSFMQTKKMQLIK